ncbi:MAG TPA: DinB family protein [Chitinophagaceae bacterium]|nr:DinB family protein [Chitinophagaceae bacterium]
MSLKDAFIAEQKHESGLTQKILERVPLDKKEWKPHEKSMTLGRLATHVAEIPHWISDIIHIPHYDFMKHYTGAHTASSSEELMKIFREKLDKANQDLAQASDETFNRQWVVGQGEKIIYQLPVKVAIRGWGMSHLYHHRGQLSVYLRLLDVPVPGMYGPSADESM